MGTETIDTGYQAARKSVIPLLRSCSNKCPHRKLGRIIRSLVVILIPAVCLVLGTNLNLRAEPELSFREYHVKAAFLYNFAKFVEWPKEVFGDPNAPIIIGILGKDPFGHYLDQTVKNKTVKGRDLVIKRFEEIDYLNATHILFITESERKRVPEILKKLKNRHVLTVSDMEGFSRLGGIINLVTEENRISFQINMDAAKRADLKISSHLLKLAKIVGDGG